MRGTLTYAEREQRKRTIISYSMAIGLYALLFGVGFLFDLFHPQNMDFSNKTLIVNIQGPVVTDVGKGAPVEKKEPQAVAAEPAPPPQPAPKLQPKVAEPAASVVPEPSPQAQEPTPAPITPVVQEPVTPWTPGERGPGSRISSSESSVLSPGEGQVPWGTGDAVRITKAEKGNTVETTLGGSSETVGQSLYVPIYLSMPLPSGIAVSLFNAIPNEIIPPNTLIASAESRKRAFLNYYSKSGDEYRLTNIPPVDVREKLWDRAGRLQVWPYTESCSNWVLRDKGSSIARRGIAPVIRRFRYRCGGSLWLQAGFVLEQKRRDYSGPFCISILRRDISFFLLVVRFVLFFLFFQKPLLICLVKVGIEKDIDDIWRELYSSHRVEFLEHFVEVERLSIGTRRRHGVESVGECDDSRKMIDSFFSDTVRISRTIPAFVMMPDRRSGSFEEFNGGKNLGADDGMHIDNLAFPFIEGALFIQNTVRNADFSYIV